jgi:hypothetical protein
MMKWKQQLNGDRPNGMRPNCKSAATYSAPICRKLL